MIIVTWTFLRAEERPRDYLQRPFLDVLLTELTCGIHTNFPLPVLNLLTIQ